ncbi:hypothetical protein HDA39_003490 [Kribbella italica]|uniref:Uncharacterized protein n=1 Tax=Kribbella italica TaxID=1540520 RepID=A0A7W9J6Y7_9ACTN|nr:hypothetical protein [Kribbella italica]
MGAAGRSPGAGGGWPGWQRPSRPIRVLLVEPTRPLRGGVVLAVSVRGWLARSVAPPRPTPVSLVEPTRPLRGEVVLAASVRGCWWEPRSGRRRASGGSPGWQRPDGRSVCSLSRPARPCVERGARGVRPVDGRCAGARPVTTWSTALRRPVPPGAASEVEHRFNERACRQASDNWRQFIGVPGQTVVEIRVPVHQIRAAETSCQSHQAEPSARVATPGSTRGLALGQSGQQPAPLGRHWHSAGTACRLRITELASPPARPSTQSSRAARPRPSGTS